MRLIREILFFEPKRRGTNIAGALDEINRMLKRKAIVVLISDFLQGPDGKLPDYRKDSQIFKALDITNRRHDLVCFELIDPRELELPEGLGVITLEDSETGEVVEVNTSSRAVIDEYARINAERVKNFKAALARCKIDLLEARTDKPFLATLRNFFKRRSRK